jgi:hypothetical protein
VPSEKEKEEEDEEEEEEEKKKKKNLPPTSTFFSQKTTRSSANVHCPLKFTRHCFHIPGRPASFIRRKYLSTRQG